MGRGSGYVVLKKESHRVGEKKGVRRATSSGVDTASREKVADGVGTDDATQSVEVGCGCEGGYGTKAVLIGVAAEQLVVADVGDGIPRQTSHMVADHSGGGKM